MRAWFAGQFENCIRLCEAVRPHDVDMVSQLALLRARAYSRLRRYDEAKQIVNSVFVAHGTLDASLTAQLILATADLGLGATVEGLHRLARLSEAAGSAHRSIRAEIDLRRAFGLYALDDLEAASSAVDQVPADVDIIFAQALNMRGWIETRRGQHDRARACFVATLEQLDTCRQQDRYLEANSLQALSHLAAEQIDASLWAFIARRAARVDWRADGLALPHFWLTMSAALVAEWSGEIAEALRLTRAAAAIAPSPAYRVHALCRRAAIGRGAGEKAVPNDDALAAREAFDELEIAGLRGDERSVPLILAEEVAHAGDTVGAARYLELYRSQTSMMTTTAMARDDRAVAHEHFVAATIADGAGDFPIAHAEYRAAWRLYRALGYTRRAAAAAVRFGALTGQDRMFEYAAIVARATAPTYWVRREIQCRERLYRDPVTKRLSAIKREVLMLVVGGLANKEIAVRVDRSEAHVKHIVSDLLAAFGEESRAGLSAACARRGIGVRPV